MEKPYKMDVVATGVFDDEPCFYLGEFNRLSPDSKRMCRYQVLRVVRDDRLVTACVYLGLASQFMADQFQLVGGTIDDNGRGEALHTVAQLRDEADEIRSQPLHREVEPSDLPGRYVAHMEELRKQRDHISTFGNSGQLVRA